MLEGMILHRRPEASDGFNAMSLHSTIEPSIIAVACIAAAKIQ